jgi:hypothetical protein
MPDFDINAAERRIDEINQNQQKTRDDFNAKYWEMSDEKSQLADSIFVEQIKPFLGKCYKDDIECLFKILPSLPRLHKNGRHYISLLKIHKNEKYEIRITLESTCNIPSEFWTEITPQEFDSILQKQISTLKPEFD